MKKMKRLVAIAAALSCAVSVSASVFAADGTAEATYAEGFVTLSDTSDINSTNQWTVVIISAELADETLDADDLLYINQGTSADSFWVVDGMGVKGGELAEGDYIIRIGGDTISSAEDLIEISFTVGDDGRVLQLGDVDFDKVIGTTDINEIISHMLGTALTGDALAAADVDQDKVVGTTDINEIISHMLGGAKPGTITVK